MGRPARYFWIGLGSLCLALGTAGIFLPILPTVPFYMATLFCFAKGSPRLHQWFLSTSLYEKHVKDFAQDRSMTLRSKVTIMCTVTCMMAVGLWFMRHLTVGPIILGIVWIAHVYCFIFVIKTKNAA